MCDYGDLPSGLKSCNVSRSAEFVWPAKLHETGCGEGLGISTCQTVLLWLLCTNLYLGFESWH